MTTFTFQHPLADLSDRASVEVDGTHRIVIIRTGDGLLIDVYPKDWDAPIDMLSVWDEDVAEANRQAEEE